MAKFAELKTVNGIEVETDPNLRMDDAEAVRRLYNLAGDELKRHWAAQGFRDGNYSLPYMVADLTNPKFRQAAMPIYKHLALNAQHNYTAKPGAPRSALLTNNLLSVVNDQYRDYMDDNWGARTLAGLHGWDFTGMVENGMAEGIANKFQGTGRVGLSALQGGHGSGMVPLTKQEIAKRDAAQKQQQQATAPQPQQGGNYSNGVGRYMIPALGAGLPIALLAGLGGKSNWILPLLALLGLGGFGYGYAKNQGWQGYQPVENLVDKFHSAVGGHTTNEAPITSTN